MEKVCLGIEKFKAAVPDNAYRLQLCQLETTLDLGYVVMVFSLPGAQVKTIIMVLVWSKHCGDLLEFQGAHAHKYMLFAMLRTQCMRFQV